ncbi:hypothetical protein BIY45_03525 [Stenotrophomonas sp. BIIR7]|nr:hypothetical protein BIY45_03525 [Stenotrophomonas sp. BIIR7]
MAPVIMEFEVSGPEVMTMKVIVTALVLSLSLGYMGCTHSAEPSGSQVEGARATYLKVRALPASEVRHGAAQEVETMIPLLATSDEATIGYVADVLRLAGCRARSALPELKAALSRFQGPDDSGEALLSYVVPEGPWGDIYNAIAVIESDGRCGTRTGR